MTNKNHFQISGTGCALVDYLYKPVDFSNPEFQRYLSKQPGDGGLSPGRLVFTEEFEHFCGAPYLQVRDNITRERRPVAQNIGGPSIVSLIHAAQMLHGSPVRVRFYGCRGNDEGGAFIERKLANTPLGIGVYKTGSHYTPFTDVLSDPDFDAGNGERIFINNIGAAWDFLPSDLDPAFFQSDMVIFGGTALVPNIHASLMALLKKAKAHHAITVVNTVFDFLSEKSDPSNPWKLGESVETYRYIDLLVTDMEESLRLSGATRVEDAIQFFRSAGTGALIITHGSGELHFFADNALFGHTPYSKLPVSEKVRTAQIGSAGKEGDTTGCGDNFTGGVIASIAKQRMKNSQQTVNLSSAVAMGVASGGFACFYNGGTFFEDHPGQKTQLIEPYYRDYVRQVGLTQTDQL